jgi:glutamate-1-semialdehyde aminotransferase
MREEPVQTVIWRRGRDLMDGMLSVIQRHDLPAEVSGIPPRFSVTFDSGDAGRDERLHRAFYSSLFRQGVFSTGGFIMSYAHSQSDIEDTIGAAMAAGEEASNVDG